MPRNRSWDEIRRKMNLDEERMAAYGRIGDAEQRAYDARVRRGMSDAELSEALGVPEDELWDPEPDGDAGLFLYALGKHIAAAGGHLELRAVFDDEEVLLLREPPQA